MISNTLNALELLDKMKLELIDLLAQGNRPDPLMIGIHTGGAWLAQKLHKDLDIQSPLGTLDISFHRDDFDQAGLNPKVQPSNLPCTTEGRHILLVDDVIMSGRTIRAALNELFDYGRPASVTLITLLDLQQRELPIQADIIGKNLIIDPDQIVKLTGPEPLALEIRNRSKD
ncbi:MULTISPECIES: bifunctional pyr operon transcriptional regulator/uracil phosphoribosyltransferase PyrR [unclassified Neptuniibacter]|jgi:pyrimidine operon attenuation protein/uracil phosphoribosyltransferase|uniref:bifunctional pyr operon transcriptional regulator/uracil phosphoribosyltransferase PyrR n=1 Tax=unclassified Neptuniibacter TaxID=2630693 RepID=UPI0026E2E83A|nr:MULTISPECIES: bifunctional pyr operon transcriptional regulator/uracil phosphoribosyltransferase PyrR [unclassified Neptuniibacter]MDO6515016.1 bifunctional pyr operon transcriptional regulator/uracil phosphoribosyltransferase PyrR [Neptuniibacter sp. 2_MG-2023]MDO6594225.1 bifunctional pyr operon transcriptional regulator/uracil phosphoribosyltransferase PyrR [Neptuniibacter sp. 1_MG-2023]